MWDEYQYLLFNIKPSVLFNLPHWWSSTTCEPDLILKRSIQINLLHPEWLTKLKVIWELQSRKSHWRFESSVVFESAISSCSIGSCSHYCRFLVRLNIYFLFYTEKALYDGCFSVFCSVYSCWLISVFSDIWIPFQCLTVLLASSVLGWLNLHMVFARPLSGLISPLSHYAHLMSPTTLRHLACVSVGFM